MLNEDCQLATRLQLDHQRTSLESQQLPIQIEPGVATTRQPEQVVAGFPNSAGSLEDW